ncbi:MAG TPA: hypothetical protein VGT41_04745 [Candidatus Babeliales bacterium]|nr:hypothetical protein [Candidatus Babeliales bacterium]
MKKNNIFLMILGMQLLKPLSCFAANAAIMKKINQEMKNKNSTATKMASLLVEAASTGEEQWIRTKVATFILTLRSEAERGEISNQEIQEIGETAAKGIDQLKDKPKQGKVIADDLRHLVRQIKSRQASEPTTEPTPIETPTAVTETDRNNYINALIRRLYLSSNLKYTENIPANMSVPMRNAYTAAIKISYALKAVLDGINNSATTPAESNDYKTQIIDILQNLATNNISNINVQLSQLSAPADVVINATTSPFTYQDYLDQHQEALQQLVRDETLFSTITLPEITETIASVQ